MYATNNETIAVNHILDNDGTEQSLKETLNVRKLVYLMSSLTINVEKTRAIWIGSLRQSTKQLCREYKLDWSQGSFRTLGVTFIAKVFDIWDINTCTEQIYISIEYICKK